MFYTMTAEHDYDEILLSFCASFIDAANRSEYQFFTHKTQRWEISSNQRFEFRELYFIADKLLVFSKKAWDNGIAPIAEQDEVFVIPLEISFLGEFRRYYIVIPTRIDCVASNGRIVTGYVGRYHIFRVPGNDKVFLNREAKNSLNAFGQITIKEYHDDV